MDLFNPENQNDRLLKKFINEGGDIDARDEFGRSAIFYAKSKDFLLKLIHAGADVNLRDKEGRTPIIHHSINGNWRFAKVLHEFYADGSLRDKTGKSGALYALEAGADTILLSDSEEIIGHSDFDGRSVFHYFNSVKLARKCADYYKMYLLYADFDGKYPHETCGTSCKPILKKQFDIALEKYNSIKDNLVEKWKAKPSAYGDVSEYLKHKAVFDSGITFDEFMSLSDPDFDCHREETVSYFLIDSDVDYRVLMLLAKNGLKAQELIRRDKGMIFNSSSIYILDFLLKSGIDVNSRDRHNATPLTYSVFRGRTEEVLRLITAGADVNARSNDGDYPILSIADKYILNLLVDAGADVNARDKKGRTRLHYIVWQDSFPTLIDTLKVGADVNAQDNDGLTPLHVCSTIDAAEILISNGADPTIKNNEGKYPFETCNEECKKFLEEKFDLNCKRILLDALEPELDESKSKVKKKVYL